MTNNTESTATTPDSNSTDRRSYLVAIILLLSVMAVLLGMNYHAQKQAQLRTIQRIQSDVDAEAQRFSMLINRLQSELHQMATGPEVSAYFRNKALGMSMEYGLRASIQNLSRTFERKFQLFPFADGSLYEHIRLFDCSGKLIAGWPELPAGQTAGLPEHLRRIDKRIHNFSQNGVLHLQTPLGSCDNTEAIIQAAIPYDKMRRHLALNDNHLNRRILLHHHQIADPQIDLVPLESLEKISRYLSKKEPFSLDADDELLSRLSENMGVSRPLVFQSEIQGYPLTLLRIESATDIYDQTASITILIVMILFSGTLVLLSLRILHSATRNRVLNQTLSQVRENEQALRERNREMKLIIDGAQLGTWTWEVQTEKLIINDTWARMLGHQATDLLPHVTTWRERLHQDDAPHIMAAIEEHLAGNTMVYTTDHRLLHAEGHWIWVRAVGQVFSRDSQGKPLVVKGIHLEITELKTALQQTEQAQKEAEAVIANFLDSLLVVDRNLLISRINKATCLLLGYSEDELLGMPVSFLFADSDEDVRACFSLAAGNNQQNLSELRNIEMTFRTIHGTSLPVSMNLARLQSDRGETIGVVAGAKDVSSLKNALLETERQNQFIERVLNVIPGGLLVMDAGYRILRNNDTYLHLLEYWTGNYALDQKTLAAMIHEQIRGRLPEQSDGTFSINAEDKVFFIEYHAARDGYDTAGNWVVYLHDVTSRLQAEEARKLHSTVLEQTSEAVVVSDTNGVFRYVNRAFTRLCGYTSAEMIGQPISLLKSPNHKKSFYARLTRNLRAGRVWSGAIAYCRKDHSQFETETTISPIRNDAGDIIYYVSLWRDVSQERALQRQLLQAQKLEAIGQLAAGVAHELNTPIQYIQNNVSFFQDSFAEIQPLINRMRQVTTNPDVIQDSAWQKDLTRDIGTIDLDFITDEIPLSIEESLQGIDHVVRIVSAMKEFSHPGQSDKSPTDVNRLIENAVIVTRNEWKYVAELTTDLDPALPLLMCEPGSWSQVMLNLIVNSAHAIVAGPAKDDTLGTIHIATRTQDQNLILTVEDNGTGIAPEHLDRIFEPFFTTKDVGKGTGQGLAIVYDLVVNKHRGTISCDSKPEMGCRFTLTIPANS